MKLLNLLVLTLFFQSTLAQPFTIKGQVYQERTLLPIYVNITISDSIGNFCNGMTGKFEIILNEREKVDTIILAGLPSFRPLMIVNLPTDNDTIDLGLIPIFGEETELAMVDFFCHHLNLICKISEKRFFRKERKKYEKIIKESNLRAAQCRYIYRNKVYRFDTSDNTILINLEKPEKIWNID